MIHRRSFLTGLIAAPVIVRAASLMPVRVMLPTIIRLPPWVVGVAQSMVPLNYDLHTPKGVILNFVPAGLGVQAAIDSGRTSIIARVSEHVEPGTLLSVDDSGVMHPIRGLCLEDLSYPSSSVCVRKS